MTARLATLLTPLAVLLCLLGSGQAVAACAGEISVHCGATPSATLDEQGRLWVAFEQNQHVYVSYSDDGGASFSSSLKVNAEPEDIEHNGENRPKIVINDNDIYVSWTVKTSPRFTGEIRFSRSTDGGQSFSAPRTINDDGLFTGHRFESLFLTDSGHLYLTWIDKRDLEASLESGEDYVGAAIYYAVSNDGGASFSDNYRVAAHSCECCRIAVAPRGEENAAILWRQIFGETTRDHAIAVLSPGGEVLQQQRASYDEWQINACPHHGPAMIQASGEENYHMSWFSNGDRHQGLYYGRFSLAREQPEQVMQVDGRPGAGHPSLARSADRLYLVWKGFDGSRSEILLIESPDDGASWSEPVTVASTSAGSDYPLLLRDAEGVYLSWLSEELGYVFQRIDKGVEGQASD